MRQLISKRSWFFVLSIGILTLLVLYLSPFVPNSWINVLAAPPETHPGKYFALIASLEPNILDSRTISAVAMSAESAADNSCPDKQTSSDTAASSTEPPIETATYNGILVGFTDEGYPYLGDADAPLTLIEYSDFLCPFCGRHFDQTAPTLINTYARAGQVRFIFRDFPIAALHPTASAGHAAARCVGEQGAEFFWAMHDELFRTQRQWNALRDPSEFVAELAQSMGADMDTYAECLDSGQQQIAVDDSVAEVQTLGFRGTPTFQLVVNETGESRTLAGALPLQTFQQEIDSRLDNVSVVSTEKPTVARQDEDNSPTAVADSEEEESDRTDSATDDASEESISPKLPSSPSDINIDDLETYEGTPVGFTEEGYPFRGDPGAPITLVEWSDYLCPFCGRHFNQTAPALYEKYAMSGDVLFVFRELPLVSLHPTAPVGHAAALCVAEQGAALFWLMHDELFRTQQQWNSLPDPSEFVAELAAEIGADMEAYAECMESGHTATAVEESVNEGRGLGFNGTPSFQFVVNETGDVHSLIGAHPMAEFSRWLDALLVDGQPPEQPEEETSELPFWANAEGLAPDPYRPGYTLAGDQYKGNPDAPLVVVEFTDFQCPACQKHALEVEPALDEAFIETDKLMWVFKHLPLREHPQAPVAAAAAECAAEQDKFWPMHHLLFEELNQWAIDDPDAELLTLAAELDLDMDEFATCFNGRQTLQRVLNDIYDAQGVVQTTPTFIFLFGDRGRLLQGSRPVEQFVKLIQSRLDEATDEEE